MLNTARHVPDESFQRFVGAIALGNSKCVNRICESPIEKLFFGSLVSSFAVNAPFSFMVARFNLADFVNDLRSNKFRQGIYATIPPLRDSFHLALQPGFKNGTKRMFADGVIWIPSRYNFRPIIIECDGYEFHSSKESFTSDRQRDRYFNSLNYEVLRYSGSELYADPVAGAKSLFERLSEYKRKLDKGVQ